MTNLTFKLYTSLQMMIETWQQLCQTFWKLHWTEFCHDSIANLLQLLIVYEFIHLHSVCICSLILTSSMGHTTHSWAAPEVAAATEMWDNEGFSPWVVDNKFKTLPYTPNKTAFCNATAASGGAMPLNKPNTCKRKTSEVLVGGLEYNSRSSDNVGPKPLYD